VGSTSHLAAVGAYVNVLAAEEGRQHIGTFGTLQGGGDASLAAGMQKGNSRVVVGSVGRGRGAGTPPHPDPGADWQHTTGDSRRYITIFQPSAATAESIASTISLREDSIRRITPRRQLRAPMYLHRSTYGR